MDIALKPNDYLVLFTDELIVNQLNQDKTNQQFFLKKNFRNNQVLIILDDVSIEQLPEYMHLFPVFALTISNALIEDADLDWEESEKPASNMLDVLNDTVLFIKRSIQAEKKDNLTIYIGPFDDNTTYEYQKLTRELLHRDYNVIPEISNPSAKELIENQAFLNEMLQTADLAIHFIGHPSLLNYPEKISPALKINSIAANFCHSAIGSSLSRIIYVPAARDDSSEMIERKISQFKNDTLSLTNAELIQTPIEKFKEIVLEKIIELAKPLLHKTLTTDAEADLYFIYPPGHEEQVHNYVKWFKEHLINFKISQVNLDQLELLSYHQKNLATCNKVLIFNDGNQQWFERKVSDIIKSPGWGRNKKFDFIAICGKIINETPLKLLSNQKIHILNDNGTPNEKELKTVFS